MKKIISFLIILFFVSSCSIIDKYFWEKKVDTTNNSETQLNKQPTNVDTNNNTEDNIEDNTENNIDSNNLPTENIEEDIKEVESNSNTWELTREEKMRRLKEKLIEMKQKENLWESDSWIE
jgi:hypothetical protein